MAIKKKKTSIYLNLSQFSDLLNKYLVTKPNPRTKLIVYSLGISQFNLINNLILLM